MDCFSIAQRQHIPSQNVEEHYTIHVFSLKKLFKLDT
jgi:hypothetical protein